MSSITGQTWNTDAYATNGRFVATLASGVVELLAPKAGERVLDLGCGDGALTEQIAATGALVTGVDNSPAMLEAARKRGLQVEQHSADELPYNLQFDAVFSNAALHWLSEERHPALLRGVHRALRPGGRFVAEMGGQGNIAAIRTALSAVLEEYSIDGVTDMLKTIFGIQKQYNPALRMAGIVANRFNAEVRAFKAKG